MKGLRELKELRVLREIEGFEEIEEVQSLEEFMPSAVPLQSPQTLQRQRLQSLHMGPLQPPYEGFLKASHMRAV